MAATPGKKFEPFVADDVQMAEFTPKAIILGALFGIIFGTATVYLALRAGLTVSASVPIAVLAIAVFKRFGRSTSVLGKTISVNRVPVTIVGVNAPEFRGAKAGGTPEIFLPISLQPRIVPNPQGSLLANNGYWWVMLMGRLKPGITDQTAEVQLGAAFRNAFHTTLPEKTDTDLPRLTLAAGTRGLD